MWAAARSSAACKGAVEDVVALFAACSSDNAWARQCDINRSAQVLMHPVPPTTSAQASVATPRKLWRSSQAERLLPSTRTAPNGPMPEERRVENEAGHERGEKDHTHRTQKQRAALAGEQIHVQ